MTKDKKKLLLIDTLSRVYYGVIVEHREKKHIIKNISPDGCFQVDGYEAWFNLESCPFKPYLRSIESMTPEERREYDELCCDFDGVSMVNSIDWLNENHFDYRGLIKKGLALEAPERMYKIE